MKKEKQHKEALTIIHFVVLFKTNDTQYKLTSVTTSINASHAESYLKASTHWRHCPLSYSID